MSDLKTSLRRMWELLEEDIRQHGFIFPAEAPKPFSPEQLRVFREQLGLELAKHIKAKRRRKSARTE